MWKVGEMVEVKRGMYWGRHATVIDVMDVVGREWVRVEFQDGMTSMYDADDLIPAYPRMMSACL